MHEVFSKKCNNLFLQTVQRQVQESLTQLELINKQYRRLARENRTDSSCGLREMAQEANQRWDNLQKRVASILRRLKVNLLAVKLEYHKLISVFTNISEQSFSFLYSGVLEDGLTLIYSGL